jgi:hypothetical protein
MRAAIALAFLIATTGAALADSGPVIVIPGRPGVPIFINGIDASFAVVEGDWGLGKGIHVQPTVYGGHYADPDPHVGHYYPSSGHLPGYGRLEIEPPSNGRPQQGESYRQSWSAQSTPQPVQPAVPFYPPAVIEAPRHGEMGVPPQDFQYRRPRNLPQNLPQ